MRSEKGLEWSGEMMRIDYCGSFWNTDYSIYMRDVYS